MFGGYNLSEVCAVYLSWFDKSSAEVLRGAYTLY
jgi:hypothetical protein